MVGVNPAIVVQPASSWLKNISNFCIKKVAEMYFSSYFFNFWYFLSFISYLFWLSQVALLSRTQGYL